MPRSENLEVGVREGDLFLGPGIMGRICTDDWNRIKMYLPKNGGTSPHVPICSDAPEKSVHLKE